MAKTVKHISHAFWISDDSGLVILASDWSDSTILPPLSLGPSDINFGALEQLSAEETGRYCRYYRNEQNWVFALQSERYPQLLNRTVRVYLAGEFNEWSEAIGKPEWELTPLSDEAGATYEVSVPLEHIPHGQSFKFKFVTENGDWLDVPDSAPNYVCTSDGVSNFEFHPVPTGCLTSSFIQNIPENIFFAFVCPWAIHQMVMRKFFGEMPNMRKRMNCLTRSF